MTSLATNGLSVTYDGRSTVTVSKRNVSEDEFNDTLSQARTVLSQFDRSKPGSDWGCEGVGYLAQQDLGIVEVHRSGVGPRKFRQGLAGKAVV